MQAFKGRKAEHSMNSKSLPLVQSALHDSQPMIHNPGVFEFGGAHCDRV
jgi:hypothetical protein